MNGFALRRDMVFEWLGSQYIIKQLNESGQVLIIREIDGQMILVNSEDLLWSYKNGELRQAGKPVIVGLPSEKLFGRPLSDLPDSVQQEVRRRLHYLQVIECNGPPLFLKRYLAPILKAAAAEIGDKVVPSVSSLYRWSRAFAASGTPRGLVPRFDKRGGKHSRQSEVSMTLLKQAVEESFLQSPSANGDAIYTRWRAKLKHANQLRLRDDQLKIPSKRTCYRYLAKVDVYEQLCLKVGKRTADQRLRVVIGGTKTEFILERVELDHTPLDLFVLDDKTLLPLGRPILTIALDHNSRMVLGYHLNFSGTSVQAVLATLRHAILPKEPVEASIPGLKVNHGWPCYGKMDQVVVDNGLEFHSTTLESIALDLGTDLQFCPKREPRFKGCIERFLKTINYGFAHQLPGTSFARYLDRLDYDSEKHAVLTLSELNHVIHKWFLDIYAQEIHRGIGMTPWARWHEGLSRRVLTLPEDLRVLVRQLGKPTTRSLLKTGISLNSLTYNSVELQPILHQYGEGTKVRVVYDPENLGEILVWPPMAQEPIAVKAADFGYASSLTELQHKLIRRKLLDAGRRGYDIDQLYEAKGELQKAVTELMGSRKQRDRRKAAAIHGKTSAHPKRVLNKTVAPEPGPTRRPRRPDTDTPLPKPFGKFNGGTE